MSQHGGAESRLGWVAFALSTVVAVGVAADAAGFQDRGSTRVAPSAEPAAPATCDAGYPASLAARVPDGARLQRHRMVRLTGVPLEVAEELLASVETAAYLFDAGELLALEGGLSDARLNRWNEAGASGEAEAAARAIEDLGVQTVEGFLRGLGERFPALETGAWGRYLIKLPRAVTRPAGARPPGRVGAVVTDGVVLDEGFETTPWARWQPSDNTYGEYQWGPTNCAAHSGNLAADGIRGGSLGSALSCSAGYPLNFETWLDDTQCENFQGASQARLDMYVWLDMEGGSDDFGVFYPGSDQMYYGVGFSGNTGGWIHLVFNLRQWYGLGDLAVSPCNRLSLLFESDEAGVVGSGVRVDDLRVTAGPASGLSCSAAAAPLSGPAPLSVSFSGNASGTSGAQTYLWSFGDGGTASSPNASHVYTSIGDYDARFRVRDGIGSCYSYLVVHVTAPGAEPLAAAAAADATSGTAPLTVHFTGSATGGTPPYTYAWDFADGAPPSTDQNPSHTFTTANSYLVTLTVHDAASNSASATTTITVSPPAMAYRYLIPAVAHNPGVGGVLWRTNVGAVNLAATTASLTVTCHAASGDVQQSASLAPGATTEWANVMESLFGYPPSTPISGSLEIASSTPLSVAARTFTQAANGTFGQFYPALTETDALAFGQLGVLPLLKKNAVFRTNIGAINLGSVAATALVKLYDTNGNRVGNPTTFTLQPSQWQQVTDIFTTSGAGPQDVAYATAEVQTSGGKLWLYASVIDGSSGDPTTVPVDVP